MKKLLFGLTLFISGVIGFVGWSIAVTQMAREGVYSMVFECFGDFDWIILCIFMIMSIVGLVLSIIEVCTDKN